MKIEVRHLSRIEGHAHLVVDAEHGEVRECRLEIVETPRLFEGILKGLHCTDVASVVARICGVCSHSHSLASLAATEKALGIETSEQTRNLRRLLAYGEIVQSHLLQLYFMAVPDYLGAPSLFPLAAARRDLLLRALRLKKLGNDLCQVVGGRAVHPVSLCIGGFSSLPEASPLQDLRRRFVAALPDFEATVELFARLEIPAFERETEYLCLQEKGYPLFGETLVSTAGVHASVAEYRSVLSEYVVPHSTAKFARTKGKSHMVGALARTRNAFAALSPMARTVASALGFTPCTTNPFHNLQARLIEVVHCVEESIRLIDRILADGLRPEKVQPPQGGGCASAAVEAPRGTLFHSYVYDDRGRLEQADCLIPTAQNLANIEADLRAFAPTLFPLGREEFTRRLEMLVRAYDPCISCSTHLLRVSFV